MTEDKNKVFKWLLKIYETLENSQLNKEILKRVRDEVIKLKTYLGTDNYIQTYLFSIIFIRILEDRTIDINRIMNYLDLKLKDNIQLVDDIDRLFEKKLIKVDEVRRGAITHAAISDFTIRKKILQAILSSQPVSKVLLEEQNDIFSFVKEVSGAVGRRITIHEKEELYGLVEKIETENSHIECIDSLIKISIGVEYRTFLYELAQDYVNDLGRTSNLKSKLFFAFGVREGLLLLRDFIEKKSIIQHFNLIELSGGDFADDVEVRLTDYALNLIFGKDAGLLIFKDRFDNSVQTDIVSLPELYFDENIKEQVDFIEKITDKSNFQALQTKLIDRGMSPGIVVLFHGEAGVGKSAVIRSIAKNTGRKIMEVSGSQKDKYYGETERRTKELFQNYNSVCSQNKADFPIMVIDEADQLITRRLSNTNEQSENTSNAQQNIILTALERNKGIIFLTTNMVENMLDAGALERRINFKVEFKRPSRATTKQVWKSNLSFLTDDQIDQLNNDYSFSPGQINNIQKKVIFDEVIENQSITFEKVKKFCVAELGIKDNNRKSIGF